MNPQPLPHRAKPPGPAFAGMEPERRRRVLSVLAGTLLLVGPLVGAGALALDAFAVALAVLGSQVLHFGAWMLLRKGRAVGWCGAAMLTFSAGAVGAISWFTGGLSSPVLPLLLLAPLGASALFGPRGLFLAAGVHALFLLGLMGWEFLLGPLPGAPRHGVGGQVSGLVQLGTLVLSMVVIGGLSRRAARAQSDRSRSEEGILGAFENLPDGFLVLEPSSDQGSGFREVYRNPAASAMFGALEKAGRSLFDLRVGHRSPQLRLDFARLAMDGKRFRVEGLSAPEAERTFDLTATLWARSILVHVQDATPGLGLRAEVEQARAAAHRASEAKAEFLAGMSREFRTPLNGVVGVAKLAEEATAEPEPEEHLATIQACAGSLLHLLGDLLDCARIESGQLELERARFDLQEVLDGVLDAMAPSAAEKGLDWTCFRRPSVPRWLMGDAGRIRQALLGLAGNAIRYTSTGRAWLVVDTVAGEGDELRLRFAVHDTGAGMAPEEAAEVLARPIPVWGAAAPGSASGRGIPFVVEMARRMGGEVRLEPREGGGTVAVFEVVLEAAAAPARAAGEEDFAGRRVLVVEHEASITEASSILLRGLGCRYEHAEDAASAAAAIEAAVRRDDPFDAVLATRAALRSEELVAQRARPDGPAWVWHRGLGEADDPALQGTGVLSLRRCSTPKALAKVLRGAFGLRAPSPRPAAPVPVEPAEPLSGRVLIADGDPVARKVLRKMVEQEGLESDGAEDGGQALRMARSGDYALVLLACELPELDGFESARRIRGFEGKGGRCAVLGMAGEDVPGTRERALRAGVDELLLMPMEQADFRAVLRRYLAVAARQDAPN